jgi:RNA polymerase sigma factor (sigma-70 family)
MSTDGRPASFFRQMGGVGTTRSAPETEFDTLYREQFPRLVRLCRLLLDDPMEAQDVAQEVFLKLVQRPPAAGPAAAWLTRVAVNACHDRRRSWWWQWTRRREDPAAMSLVAIDPTPERWSLGEEFGMRVWTAFRALPRRQREVFALRHFEEWPTADVAEALGLSRGSVKQHLFRAVRSLRNALGDYR